MTREEANVAHREAEEALVLAFMLCEATDYRRHTDPRTSVVQDWVAKAKGNVIINSLSNMGFCMRQLVIQYGQKSDPKTYELEKSMQINLCPCGRSYSVIGPKGKVLDYTPCYAPKEGLDEGERTQP